MENPNGGPSNCDFSKNEYHKLRRFKVRVSSIKKSKNSVP
jgi:hypothetical protein